MRRYLRYQLNEVVGRMELLVVEQDVAKVLELPIWIDENVKDVLDERSELVERL